MKSSQAVFHRPRVSGIEKSDDGYRWLLRASRERPRCRRPAQEFDELAPPHCLSRLNRSGGPYPSIDHKIVIIIMRDRQTLRTRHSHCCVVKRTSKRAGGKCSDAKPCVDTNQKKHGDSDGEQSDLTHVTLCILGRMQASSIRCAGMLPPSQPLARPNHMGTAATRLAVALDRLGGAKTRFAGGGQRPFAKIVRDLVLTLLTRPLLRCRNDPGVLLGNSVIRLHRI